MFVYNFLLEMQDFSSLQQYKMLNFLYKEVSGIWNTVHNSYITYTFNIYFNRSSSVTIQASQNKNTAENIHPTSDNILLKIVTVILIKYLVSNIIKYQK